jgi:hypothetical protein
MQPNWSAPVPQAMQQHRGSQLRKPAPAAPSDGAAPPNAAPAPELTSSKTQGPANLGPSA